MARQPKKGLDYFPMDVSILNDRKFRKVKMKYGCLGFMVYFSILCLIYRDKGYYLDYEDKDNVVWDILEILQGKYQPTTETIVEIIEELVASGLFSLDQFNSKIITSKRIQSTYYSATVERNAIDVDFKRWILTEIEMLELSKRHILLQRFQGRPINEVNRPINKINQTKNTQSKEEEIKEEEIREDILSEVETSDKPIIISLTLNNKCEYPIYEDKVNEWEELYPAVNILQQLKNMKGWIDSNPNRRKTKTGILRFINSWLAKEQNNGGKFNNYNKTFDKNTQTYNYSNDYSYNSFEELYSKGVNP